MFLGAKSFVPGHRFFVPRRFFVSGHRFIDARSILMNCPFRGRLKDLLLPESEIIPRDNVLFNNVTRDIFANAALAQRQPASGKPYEVSIAI
jgi:hypothetical protein